MRITARQKIKHFCKQNQYRLFEHEKQYITHMGYRTYKTVRIEDAAGEVLESRSTFGNLWEVYRELAEKYLDEGVRERRIV